MDSVIQRPNTIAVAPQQIHKTHTKLNRIIPRRRRGTKKRRQYQKANLSSLRLCHFALLVVIVDSCTATESARRNKTQALTHTHPYIYKIVLYIYT